MVCIYYMAKQIGAYFFLMVCIYYMAKQIGAYNHAETPRYGEMEMVSY